LFCAVWGLAGSDVLGDIHKDENVCVELDALEKHIHSFRLWDIDVSLHGYS